MKHLIMGVPKNGNFPAFEVGVAMPTNKLAAIMNWQDESDWMFDYQLDAEQISAIEEIEQYELPKELDLFLTSRSSSE